MKKSEKNESSITQSGIFPFFVLIFLCSGFFAALTTIVPSFLEGTIPDEKSLPAITKLLFYLIEYPAPAALLLFLAGGIVLVFSPKTKPLQITAMYIAFAFILSLWITFIILIPQTFCHIKTPFP